MKTEWVDPGIWLEKGEGGLVGGNSILSVLHPRRQVGGEPTRRLHPESARFHKVHKASPPVQTACLSGGGFLQSLLRDPPPQPCGSNARTHILVHTHARTHTHTHTKSPMVIARRDHGPFPRSKNRSRQTLLVLALPSPTRQCRAELSPRGSGSPLPRPAVQSRARSQGTRRSSGNN